jgi:hypothetical protein
MNRSLFYLFLKKFFKILIFLSLQIYSSPRFPVHSVSSSFPKEGLAGFYPFQGNVADESGNGNHGIVHTGFTYVSDRFGVSSGAISLDGTSGSVKLQLPNFRLYNLTISLWINPNAPQHSSATLVDIFAWASRSGMSLQLNGSNDLLFRTYYGAIDLENAVIYKMPSNQWTHFALTKLNRQINVYINGTVQARKYLFYPFNETSLLSTLLLGTSSQDQAKTMPLPQNEATEHFRGAFHALFLFNRSLSENELHILKDFEWSPTQEQPPDTILLPQPKRFLTVTDLPTGQPTGQPSYFLSSADLKKNLVAYFPFNGNAHDESGNGNDGVIHSTVTLVTDRFDYPNRAYSFSGGYIEIPGRQFNLVFDMSIVFWIKPNLVSGLQVIIDKTCSNKGDIDQGYTFYTYPTPNFQFVVVSAPLVQIIPPLSIFQ